MGIFFIYILKSSVCLVLFYLCYRILLSKETFHRFNRMALLSIIVLSFVLPFIEVTLPQASEISQPFLMLEENYFIFIIRLADEMAPVGQT